ncbi:MAG: flagellar hook-basal body protein [Oscillospiraceae bacterium]|nr:flagellar hook-basal body protein [Oscillospiraceae bacterium]
MLRGFYTAASAMHTQEKRLNVYANNIANVGTAGFKRDGLIAGTFGEHMAVRMNMYQGSPAQDIGPGVFMNTITAEYTDYSQGGPEFTGNPYHFAIMGDGYFVIQTPDGGTGLTRNGQFALDEEGYLVLSNYGRVQGEGGDILLENHRFTVSQDGMIFLEDEEGELNEIDRLLIVMPLGDEGTFKKDENEMFVAAAGFAQVDPLDAATAVLQNSIERSNVNIADEMSLIIASQRTLRANGQILRMYDELVDNVNQRISRPR